MAVTHPEQLNDHYNDLFRVGDVEGLVALYESDATLSPAPGQFLMGSDAIRGQMRALVDLDGELTATQLSCVRAGDIALLHAAWHFVGKAPSGEPIALGGTSSKVARRAPDGAWRYVIDLPVTPERSA